MCTSGLFKYLKIKMYNNFTTNNSNHLLQRAKNNKNQNFFLSCSYFRFWAVFLLYLHIFAPLSCFCLYGNCKLFFFFHLLIVKSWICFILAEIHYSRSLNLNQNDTDRYRPPLLSIISTLVLQVELVPLTSTQPTVILEIITENEA